MTIPLPAGPPLRPLLPALLFALAAGSAGAVDAEGWSPGEVVDDDGFSYQIFSKESGEGFVLYQARGRIQAAPATLVRAVRAVVSDPERAPEGQSRRVVDQDARGFTVYTHIDLPAFFSDRDIITRGIGSVDAESGAHRIDWEAIEHEAVPPTDDAIRIARSAGFWDFRPDGEGGSAAVYETYVDLGGSLPGWLIQPLMGSMVGGTYADVAREALGR